MPKITPTQNISDAERTAAQPQEKALVRLNKALADAGLCSRRKADELISAGVVSVNGTQIDQPGLRIDPAADSVTVHGKPLVLLPAQASHTYLMLHKPIQTVATAHDPEGRATVLDLLPEEYRKKRLYPVGRLDYFSEGLLLLTDDGDLTHRLTHPRHHIPRVYEVRLREAPAKDALAVMRRGMRLAEGETLAPVGVEVSPDSPALLMLTLHQGVNRQIRRMCRDLRLTILTLRRVSFGPLLLGDLPKGRCRRLTENELAELKKAVKLA